MFVVRLIGGLGNQMFQYAFARKLSITKGMPFKLDVNWYAEGSFSKDSLRFFELDEFNIATGLAAAGEIRAARRYPVRRIFRKIRRKIFGENYGYDPRAFAVRDGDYLEGFWQSERYFADVADTIRKDLTLKAGLGGAARELETEILSGESVSVHVRRGDYISEKILARIYGNLGPDYYRRAVELIKSKTASPRFFVFSDDVAWAKENLDLGAPTVFVSRPGLDDAEELVLMSRCRHHIIANSSFSWWGAWLDPRPDKIVVAPKRWFRSWRFRTRDILPAYWIGI